MRISRLTLWVLVAVVLTATAGTLPAGEDGAVFPFVKGTTWTYAGTVRWTPIGNHPRSGTVRWTSAVADAFDDGEIAAALLKGGVWDLAWWSPDARAGSYLLLRVQTRYYLVGDDAKAMFSAIRTSGRKALPADLEEKRWFETPRKPGRLYRAPSVAPREDTRYGWLIASAPPVNAGLARMKTATRSAYVLSYITLPDEESLTVLPGVGVTSFAYLHHGTVSEANVHLVGFHRGGVQ
ncbi:MAG TPA: hypothetical protein VGC72_06300 [Candidatus Elarobacter sp.]|jgi:hypothetical protein